MGAAVFALPTVLSAVMIEVPLEMAPMGTVPSTNMVSAKSAAPTVTAKAKRRVPACWLVALSLLFPRFANLSWLLLLSGCVPLSWWR